MESRYPDAFIFCLELQFVVIQEKGVYIVLKALLLLDACEQKLLKVTIHGNSKHHAKNHPAMPSGAAKPAAFVFLMMFRTAYTLISENNQPLMCKHNKFDYFLKSAVNSNYEKYLERIVVTGLL